MHRFFYFFIFLFFCKHRFIQHVESSHSSVADTFITTTTSSGDPISGTSITLSCTKTESGNPNIEDGFRWHKDGTVIDGSNGELQLSSLSSPGDNGEYKCAIQNSAGWTSLSDATGYTVIVWCKYHIQTPF
jgi:hypothetical protein